MPHGELSHNVRGEDQRISVGLFEESFLLERGNQASEMDLLSAERMWGQGRSKMRGSAQYRVLKMT